MLVGARTRALTGGFRLVNGVPPENLGMVLTARTRYATLTLPPGSRTLPVSGRVPENLPSRTGCPQSTERPALTGGAFCVR